MLKVKAVAPWDENVPLDCTYTISLKSGKTNTWESEFNGTKADADKADATETGYFWTQFFVDSDATEEDILSGWDINIYDSKISWKECS